MDFNRGNFVSSMAGLIVGALLVSVVPAVAANGDPVILGTKNTSLSSTKLQSRNSTQLVNTKAGRPALRLVVRDGAPPMALESQVKVENLNADLLDGMDSGAFHSGRTEFFLMMSSGETETLVTHGSLSIDAACEADGDTEHQVSIYVDASAAYYTFLTPHAAGRNLEVTWQSWQGVSNSERLFWVPSTGDAVWVYFGAVDQDIESTDCILVGRSETIGG